MTTPKRLQRQRTKGWRKPPGAICVTRPGPFGNPFTTAEAFRRWLIDGTVAVMDLTDEWFPWEITSTEPKKKRLAQLRTEILRRLPDLRGKDLLCWCGLDHDCHGDVLIELANLEVPQ